MENRGKTLIVTGILILIIVAIMFGAVYYLINMFRNFRSPSTASPAPNITRTSPSPTSQAFQTPGPSASAAQPQSASNTKMYSGQGFTLYYPKTWGLLTCSTTPHVELDPYNSADQAGVNCDYAAKPITVLVGQNSCQGGEVVNLGGTQVMKIKKQTAEGTSYKWCVAQPALEISHRVSANPNRATSKDDFSGQIENMIKNLFGPSGGS
jgi:hypothetical protein